MFRSVESSRGGMVRRTSDWLRLEEIVNHGLKDCIAVFAVVCHQVLQYQPPWQTFVAVFITQTLEIMTLTASNVDYKNIILRAHALHEAFLYGVVVQPTRFSDAASSHVRVKTVEGRWVFLHPVEKRCTIRVVESRM